MIFPRAVLLVAACTFAFFGLWAVAAPQSQLELVEIGFSSPTARADLRAQYGGFTLGIGVFLLACLAYRAWTRAGLAASACVLSGFFIARAISTALDGPVAPIIYYLTAFEGCGALLSVIGWRTAPR
jgi:hypothetical protein